MPIFTYLPTLLSSLFRAAVYIFLRVIPSSLGKFVLPALYFAHLFSSTLFAPRSLNVVRSEKTKAGGSFELAPEESVLRTVILSLPSTSRRLRLLNVFLNTLLFLAAADLSVTPYLDPADDVLFTRVGAVYPDSVKVITRYPENNTNGTTTALRILYRESTNPNTSKWNDGPLLTFEPQHDWVDTTRITGLWPNTSYEYVLSTPNRTILDYPKLPVHFNTFPDPRLSTGNRFTFVVSSCIMPNFPYRGPTHRRSIRGFDLLADYLYPSSLGLGRPNETAIDPIAPFETAQNYAVPGKAQFLLLLGDFIYADVPIYFGDDREAYRRLYRRNYNSGSFRKLYERLPIFHAYDDHEFINNFGASGNDSTPPYQNASSSFKLYNSNANFDPILPGEHYYEFKYGDVAFFVLDTRRYRTEMGTANRTMLGEAQLASLHKWLSRVNTTSTFKFVVTSVPFTSLWGYDAQYDSWAGFPEERSTLLAAFHSVPNVILLSGDRHEFAAIEFTSPKTDDYPVWEFSTSPLSMFYIPLVRTLRMQSESFTQKNRTKIVPAENGPEIVYYVEDVPLEQVVKYIPNGNYKWSALEIDTMDRRNPFLKLETIVDGRASFDFKIAGVPTKPRLSTALGAFVVGGVEEMISKFGIKPSKWF